MSHVTPSKRSFKEYGANDKVEAMTKEQIAKSAREEAAKKKSQATGAADSVASADATAKANAGTAAASGTNNKVNKHGNRNLA